MGNLWQLHNKESPPSSCELLMYPQRGAVSRVPPSEPWEPCPPPQGNIGGLSLLRVSVQVFTAAPMSTWRQPCLARETEFHNNEMAGCSTPEPILEVVLLILLCEYLLDWRSNPGPPDTCSFIERPPRFNRSNCRHLISM